MNFCWFQLCFLRTKTSKYLFLYNYFEFLLYMLYTVVGEGDLLLQIGLGLFTAGWRRQNTLTAPPHVSDWPIPLGCFCNLPLVSRHCRSSFFVCWIEVLGLSGLYLVALVLVSGCYRYSC